jgi:hypothetical protein
MICNTVKRVRSKHIGWSLRKEEFVALCYRAGTEELFGSRLHIHGLRRVTPPLIAQDVYACSVIARLDLCWR